MSLQTAPAAPSGGAFQANAICVFSMLAWAAGFPASELLLDIWDPLALIAARLLMAVTVLVPLWMLIEGPRVLTQARWRRGFVVGGVGFGAGTYLLLVGQAATDPVLVAIIASAMPVAGAVLEIALDGRRITRTFALGMAIAVLGGLIAAAYGAGSVGQIGLGALAALGSVILFAWGSRAAVKEFPELTPLGRTNVTLSGALLFAALALLVAERVGTASLPAEPFDLRQFRLLAVYAVGAMALSQLLWIIGVGRLGVALASFHINAVPFYVMLMMLALGGAWNWPRAIGAGIVVLGVVIAQRR